MPEDKTTDESVLPTIDNSEYVLQHEHICTKGKGESRNQQQARSKSRTAALDSAMAILLEVVSGIAEERGFVKPSIEVFQFVNTKTTDERITAFNNDKGIRIYRSVQTISVEMEPVLRAVYCKLNAGQEYGWYMFLRDIDRQLDIKNNKE